MKKTFIIMAAVAAVCIAVWYYRNRITATTIEPTAPEGAQYYIVQPADTLTGIAHRFGTTIDALLALNPQITDPNVIYADDVIRLS